MTDRLAPFTVPAGRILAARSHLVDRIVPECEIIARPAFDLLGGELTGTIGLGTLSSSRRRWDKWRQRSEPLAVGPDRILVDLRRNAPQNWAHFLNNHLPLVFHLADRLDLDMASLLAIMPPDTPKHIEAAAALFGLDIATPAGGAIGTVLSFDVDPWHGMRSVRHQWVRADWPRRAIRKILSEPAAIPLPPRPFLARRDSRCLSNLAEVKEILGRYGFETVYSEDLSAADQMRLILGAEEIVAIHGAALAPMLYVGGIGVPAPRRLVELLPCGHMTDVYRVMAAQTGIDWIGVRGRIKPEYVRPSYDFSRPFKAYSLDNFEIDPVSLELALALEDGDITG